MLALGFDTATPNVGVALVDDSGLIDSSDELAANRPGEQLPPAVAVLMERNGVAPTDVDVIGVGLGPGPFTGLRVGIVFAAAMGHALEIPVHGFCSLDALEAPHRDGDSAMVVITDARRREVYWARYDPDGVRVDGPRVDLPDVVAGLLRPDERIAGAGALLYRDRFDREPVGAPEYPVATYLAEWALRSLKVGEEPAPLRPLYLRRADAATSYTAKSVLT